MDARVTAFAITVALAALFAAACGGSSSDSPKLRDATEADLPATVLQGADVPLLYDRFDGTKQGLGLQHNDQNLNSSAQYGVDYQLNRALASDGNLACVSSGTSLYATGDAARAGLEKFDSVLKQANYVSDTSLDLGSDTRAYRGTFGGSSFCENYSNVTANIYTVTFVRANILCAVKLTYLTKGGSMVAAGDYAKKQIAIVEAALKQQ